MRPPATPAARRAAGLAGGMVGALVASWSSSSLGGMVPQLAEAYGVSIAAVGLLVTLAYFGNLAAQVPTGILLDRYGAHRTALVGLTAILAGNAVAAVADAYALAVGGRMLAGLGVAGVFLGAMEYLRTTHGSPVIQGFFGAFNGLGVVTLAIVPFLARWLSWRAPFVSSAVLAAICIGLMLVAPRSHGGPGSGRAGLGETLRDWAIYRVAFTILTPVALSFIASAWTATLLIERHDAPATLAGAVGALVVVAGVLTRPLGGVLARRSRTSIARWLAVTMTLGGVATIVLALAPSMAVAAPAAAAMGLATGVPFPLGFGAAAQLRPTAPGHAVALANRLIVATVLVSVALLGLTFSPLGDGRIGFLLLAAAWLAPVPLLPGTVRMLGRRGALTETHAR